MPHSAHRHEAELGTAALNAQSVDDEKVASAIKTDFILSAEIMAITLAAIPTGSRWKQALVLALVSPGFSNGWWRPPSRSHRIAGWRRIDSGRRLCLRAGMEMAEAFSAPPSEQVRSVKGRLLCQHCAHTRFPPRRKPGS